jgi:hypothetical protein
VNAWFVLRAISALKELLTLIKCKLDITSHIRLLEMRMPKSYAHQDITALTWEWSRTRDIIALLDITALLVAYHLHGELVLRGPIPTAMKFLMLLNV